MRIRDNATRSQWCAAVFTQQSSQYRVVISPLATTSILRSTRTVGYTYERDNPVLASIIRAAKPKSREKNNLSVRPHLSVARSFVLAHRNLLYCTFPRPITSPLRVLTDHDFYSCCGSALRTRINQTSNLNLNHETGKSRRSNFSSSMKQLPPSISHF
jgi:hypothetical protein